jgi:hypothetical protein
MRGTSSWRLQARSTSSQIFPRLQTAVWIRGRVFAAMNLFGGMLLEDDNLERFAVVCRLALLEQGSCSNQQEGSLLIIRRAS